MTRQGVFSAFLLLISALTISACKADTVKMSRSGLCHPEDSAHYQRTQSFTPYANLESCLADGGRLPKNYTKQTSENSYHRDNWPHWLDTDHDCQDARAEVLIAQSYSDVSYTTQARCTVTSGQWHDPYSGQILRNDDDLDIDHIVPLKFAYEHGAATWSRSQKAQFANDMENLLAVDDGLNRSKGAKGPWQWLPPHQDYRCQYIQRFNYIMSKYDLRYSQNEKDQVQSLLQSCIGETLNLSSLPTTLHQ